MLEQVDERTYKGKVSVRLGPIALSFLGTVFFEHLDDTLKQARVRASGADSKGRGGAAATVDFALLPVADGTSVRIKTKLDLTGSIAQYGRASGVLQSVANQLVSGSHGWWRCSGLGLGPSTSPNHHFWRSAVDTRTDRIRMLNDDLRQYLLGGLAVITPGISANFSYGASRYCRE